MARYGSPDIAFLLLDGLSVLGDQTELTDNVEAVLEEVTALGESVDSHEFVGLKRWTMNQVGFYNDAAGRNNAALVEPDGSERLLMYGVEGNTIGQKVTMVRGAQVRYRRLPTLAALTKAEAEYRAAASNALEQGVISHELAAETGDGTSSASVDNAAQSTGGGAFHIQVSAITLDGATNVTIKLQDSADDISFSDVSGASQAVTAAGAWRKAISGTIRRYTQTVWAKTGGTSPVTTFASGLYRA